MRRKVKNRKELQPDAIYNSQKVTKLINYVMNDGKKEAARKIVFGALSLIKEKQKVENPLEIFDTALRNITPLMEVRSRRVGGANYQVPVEVRPVRRMALSMRWLREAANKRSEKSMPQRLGGELLEAAESRGGAMKKRDEVHRMAEANKAFSHFRF